MIMPIITRRASARMNRDLETECWELRRRLRAALEREAARIVCVEAIEADARRNREEREELEREAAELRERVRQIAEDNRDLRHRYDTTRAELAKATRELTSLRLMRASLEARLSAESEVE